MLLASLTGSLHNWSHQYCEFFLVRHVNNLKTMHHILKMFGFFHQLASAILVILDSVYFAGGLSALNDILQVLGKMFIKITISLRFTHRLFQDYENDCNGYYSECDFDPKMIKAGEAVSNFCRYFQFLESPILLKGILSLNVLSSNAL